MNTLESYTTENPYGRLDECARLNISETAEWFVFSDIVNVGLTYTFSAWIKSDAKGGATICNSYITTSEEWTYHKITFVADNVNIYMIFNTPGTYYIYHSKLGLGPIDTDWSPAPEDLDETKDLTETNERIQLIYENVSSLKVATDGIVSNVSDVQKTLDLVTGELVAVRGSITSVQQTAEGLTMEVQKLTNDGAQKVTTTTGKFDDEGLEVDRSDSPTKTRVTPTGMIVYKKSAIGSQSEVLKATSDGVDATNLHAKTYLIVGGRSRFENYGTDRTGCFWIGG